MRGRKMSSANFVWPVHFARASTLRNGLPTTFSGFPLLPFFILLVMSHGFIRINADLQKIISKHPIGISIREIHVHLWPILFAAIQTLPRQFHLFPAHV